MIQAISSCKEFDNTNSNCYYLCSGLYYYNIQNRIIGSDNLIKMLNAILAEILHPTNFSCNQKNSKNNEKIDLKTKVVSKEVIENNNNK